MVPTNYGFHCQMVLEAEACSAARWFQFPS
jgi:hypothetical protein